MGLTRIRAEQISDIDFKQAVRVVTTTDITLSGSAPTVVDGVTLAANNRVLVAGQSTASQNGIYVVTTLGTGSNGTWTRSTDANATGEIEAGMIVMVTDGTIYADTQWVLATNNPIVVGTTPLSFQQNITNTGNVSAGSSGIRVLANSNVLVSVSGTANVATFAVDGLYVTGNITSGNLAVSNDVVITGNLTVNGNTTTINSNVVTTNDKTITLANNQTTGANVDGSGIDVGSTGIATWRYNDATTSWQSNIAVTPAANATLNLGGTANYWSTVYANTASLAGNVTSSGAVISTINATTISATGNVTGNYILGNGALLTGVITSVANINSGTSNVTVVSSGGNVSVGVGGTGNVAVWATTGEYVTGILSASGNVYGAQFVGNGAPLTNITGANVAGTVANATYATSAGSATTATTATSATTATTASTVTTAAQGNITSVGTLTSLSVTGNTISGNLLTGGQVSAAGNITGLNLFGTIQTGSQLNITQLGVLSSLNASGNVTGGNINTSGLISATGSGYFGAGLSVVGNITATGNINFQNVTDLVVGDPLIYIGANNTTNLVDLGIVASANVSGTYQYTGLARDHNTNIWRLFANVATLPTTEIDWANSVYAPFAAGAITSNSTISASGNITGNYIIGNGSQLTGLPASYGNANVVANLAALGSNPISTTGNITGNYIIGNGSQLTGLPASYGNANVVANLAALGSNPVSTTGNISAGNLITGNGSGGNLSGANVISATTLSATGNITGNYILGNGALLTGVITSVANINAGNSNVTVVSSGGNVTVGVGGTANVAVFASTGEYVTGVISATGNITGGNVISGGVRAYKWTTVANTAPSNPVAGDNWYDSYSDKKYQYTYDGVNSYWVDQSFPSTYASLTITGNTTSGNLLTGGIVSATGNITGLQFIGNGAPLTTLTGANVTGTVANATYATSAGSATTAGTVTTAAQGNITSVGTLTSLSVAGNIVGGNLSAGTGTITGGNIVNSNANGVGNIGSSTTYFNTVFAKATSAQYADLAELYVADQSYLPGTVVEFGGKYEITVSQETHSSAVAGIISTNPSYLMNSTQSGEYVLPVALTGRVPCKVVGKIRKGDRLVASAIPGVAIALNPASWIPGCIIGKSLEAYDSNDVGVIEVAVGRT
jgi:fibronectin-binding autotransporter adhesin